MSDQSSPLGWPGQSPVTPAPAGLHGTAPPDTANAHPLLWPRMPAEMPSPALPSTPEEALALMERSHAATVALLPEDDADIDETTPLTRAWFDGVREACAATGRVPGVERMLFEWWINDPPFEGLTQLPWLFGVWQSHWVCWAGTTPWAAADLAAKSTYDETAVMAGVQFGADPEHPPATPWPPFGTAALAVPTAILVALSGKPAPQVRLIPTTPLYVAPPMPMPEPPPPPAPEPAATTTPLAVAGVAAAGGEAAVGALDPDETPDAPDAPDTEVTTEPATSSEPEVDSVSMTEAEGATVAPASADAAAEPEPEAIAASALDQGAGTEAVAAAEVAPVAPVAPIESPPPAQNLPPAGWHPDPSGRHALRYWDGAGWTAHAADPGTDTLYDPI